MIYFNAIITKYNTSTTEKTLNKMKSPVIKNYLKTRQEEGKRQKFETTIKIIEDIVNYSRKDNNTITFQKYNKEQKKEIINIILCIGIFIREAAINLNSENLKNNKEFQNFIETLGYTQKDLNETLHIIEDKILNTIFLNNSANDNPSTSNAISGLNSLKEISTNIVPKLSKKIKEYITDISKITDNKEKLLTLRKFIESNSLYRIARLADDLIEENTTTTDVENSDLNTNIELLNKIFPDFKTKKLTNMLEESMKDIDGFLKSNSQNTDIDLVVKLFEMINTIISNIKRIHQKDNKVPSLMELKQILTVSKILCDYSNENQYLRLPNANEIKQENLSTQIKDSENNITQEEKQSNQQTTDGENEYKKILEDIQKFANELNAMNNQNTNNKTSETNTNTIKTTDKITNKKPTEEGTVAKSPNTNITGQKVVDEKTNDNIKSNGGGQINSNGVDPIKSNDNNHVKSRNAHNNNINGAPTHENSEYLTNGSSNGGKGNTDKIKVNGNLNEKNIKEELNKKTPAVEQGNNTNTGNPGNPGKPLQKPVPPASVPSNTGSNLKYVPLATIPLISYKVGQNSNKTADNTAVVNKGNTNDSEKNLDDKKKRIENNESSIELDGNNF